MEEWKMEDQGGSSGHGAACKVAADIAARGGGDEEADEDDSGEGWKD